MQVSTAHIVMIALSLVGSGLTQNTIHWMPRRTANIQSVSGDNEYYSNAQNVAPYNAQLHNSNNNMPPYNRNNNMQPFINNNQMRRSTAANNNFNNAPTCITPLGDAGLCVSLQMCSEVLTLYTRLQKEKATEYAVVLQNLCGRRITADNYPVVCCTRSSLHRVTPIKTPDNESKEKVDEEEEEESLTTRRSTTTTRRPRRTTEKTTTTTTRGRSNQSRNCSRLMRDEDSDVPDWANHINVRVLDSDPCPDDNTEETVTSRNQRSSTPRTTDDDSYPFITEKQNCGVAQQTSQISRIVGGWDSSIGEWPWLVLLGYDPHSLAPFKCGGTLVTSRHVVTAAHCIILPSPSSPKLSFIRLGEFDLSMENETDYIDVNVAKSVTHPDFRGYKNDIAVILMQRSVEFTELIRPICMPTSEYMRTKSFVRYSPFVAGWGRTMEGGSGSTVMKTLQIPIHENNICRNAFLSQNVRESHHAFDQTIVCAGQLAGGQDTCQGDSGGPLMIPEPFKGVTRYYLLGIVSYGLGCGRVGLPGIYTSTQHYIDWIAQQVQEM